MPGAFISGTEPSCVHAKQALHQTELHFQSNLYYFCLVTGSQVGQCLKLAM